MLKRRVMLHYGIKLMTAYEDRLPLEMGGQRKINTSNDTWTVYYLALGSDIAALLHVRTYTGAYRTQPEGINSGCSLLGIS